MPEKVKEPANPTTNLLQNIRSPQPSDGVAAQRKVY